jgi:hypothetical protein
MRRWGWRRPLGEYLLIVAGVLTALGLEAWVGHQRDRAAERGYLERLHADLAADTLEIGIRERYLDRVTEYGIVTLRMLAGESPQGWSAPALVDAAHQASQISPWTPQRFTYMDLVSTGRVGVLRDVSLRAELARYYARVDSYSPLLNGAPVYRDRERRLIPWDAQRAIPQECPALSRRAEARPCELAIDPERARRILDDLRSDPALAGDLHRWLSEIVVIHNIYETELLALALPLLARLESPGAESSDTPRVIDR